MKDVEIKTNYQPKQVFIWEQLTEKEKKEFDFDGAESMMYFRYKGNIYCLDEFMRLDNENLFPDYWHGYQSETFFSGVLVHLIDEHDADRLSLPPGGSSDFVIVGHYYS